MAFRYGRLGDDIPAVAGLLVKAFNTPPSSAPAWIDASGHDNFRVLRSGRSTIGCALLIPMGQWFGGRSVQMTGIAGVAIAPEERGRGAAHNLMKSTVKDLAESGAVLSTLFASTQSLYRGVGYELAGQRVGFELHLTRLALTPPTPADSGKLSVAPIAGEHRSAVRKLHAEVARHRGGYLDRGDYIWRRVETPRGQECDGYGVWSGNELEGYAFLTRVSSELPYYELRLTDLCATTSRATRRLLKLLRDHATLAERALVHDAPSPAFLSLLSEQAYRIASVQLFMVRVIDARRALEQRGYGAGAQGTVHLSIRDELLPQNDGRLVLDVADGLGQVRRGGKGTVELDVRALASLYTGHLSAEQLRALGWLTGPDRDVAIASNLFAGPPPGTADMF